ncbi:MAG: protein adenylyltransferase SelO family protein, partial [Methylocystis sp.]
MTVMSLANDTQSMGWNFDHSYRALPSAFFSEVLPTPGPEPRLIIFNDKLAQELGLNCSGYAETLVAATFCGNILPTNSHPIAQAYAGHQFGHFTMLGDGRAILLGEHITPSGKRVDVQLKGAGLTPYSRRGDGKAAIGPMLREYIISEALNALAIPTTRSLAVVTTGENIYREGILKGAI